MSNVSNARQLTMHGVTFTYGDCNDPKWKGKKFVSIGTKHNHTTFIVSSDYATVSAIESRGTDKEAWKTVANAITSGFWD